MGNVSASITQYTVQGNRRVHFGTLTMSSSYAASGDAYTDLSTFGMTTVEHLDLLPVGGTIGFHGYWNSGATAIKVVTSRPQSSYAPGATALVLFGANATAGAALFVQSVGGSVFLNTGSIAIAFVRGGFVSLHASTSTQNDYTNALATSSMGQTVTVAVYTRLATTAAPGLPVYVASDGTNTFLHTTGSVVFGLPSAGAALLMLNDGGCLRVGADTTAGVRLLATDSAATGLRVRTTLTANISIPVSNALSLAQSTEPPTGCDLSTSGANVAFKFTAVGY